MKKETKVNDTLWKTSAVLLALVFLQLVFGALMRHTESGLALLDFPRSAGQWIPAFNAEMLQKINAARSQLDLEPVTFAQVGIHFAHRIGALLVSITALGLFLQMFVSSKISRQVRYSVAAFLIALLAQITLGALTVLTQKAPTLTSFHVVLGAVTLGLSALIFLRAYPFENYKSGTL